MRTRSRYGFLKREREREVDGDRDYPLPFVCCNGLPYYPPCTHIRTATPIRHYPYRPRRYRPADTALAPPTHPRPCPSDLQFKASDGDDGSVCGERGGPRRLGGGASYCSQPLTGIDIGSELGYSCYSGTTTNPILSFVLFIQICSLAV